ncbi:MAG: hypothetical protein QF785_10410 [Phycisphaeraceae bacterium]|nr:hypothetical protein [Phycisphaeraceae bacterium]
MLRAQAMQLLAVDDDRFLAVRLHLRAKGPKVLLPDSAAVV